MTRCAGCLIWGSGFGVWGLGFGAWGFGVLGFGFEDWGLVFGLKVWGLGFGVWDWWFGVWGLGFGFWSSCSMFLDVCSTHYVLYLMFSAFCFIVYGLGFRVQSLDFDI